MVHEIDIWFFLVKSSTILIFTVIFFVSIIKKVNLLTFLKFKNIKKGEQLLLLTFFDNFNIPNLFSKSVPNV